MSTGHSPVVEHLTALETLLAPNPSPLGRASWPRPSTREHCAVRDVSLLCVGTPSAAGGETNLTYIHRVVDDLMHSLREVNGEQASHTVVIRSTVPPGTVRARGPAAIRFPGIRDWKWALPCAPSSSAEGTGYRTFTLPLTR